MPNLKNIPVRVVTAHGTIFEIYLKITYYRYATLKSNNRTYDRNASNELLDIIN